MDSCFDFVRLRHHSIAVMTEITMTASRGPGWGLFLEICKDPSLARSKKTKMTCDRQLLR